MGGFLHDEIRFEPDDGFTVVGFDDPEDFVEEGLAVGPEGARASWLAARLAALTDRDARVFGSDIEVEEDGLFIVDLLAELEGGRVLAKLQLQADPAEVAILGVAGDEAAFRRARDGVVAALEREPTLADVEVRVAKDDDSAPIRYGCRDGALL